MSSLAMGSSVSSVCLLVCVCMYVTIVNTGYTLEKIKNVTIVDFDVWHLMASLREFRSVTLI